MPFPTVAQYKRVLSRSAGQRPFRSPDLDTLNHGQILPSPDLQELLCGSGTSAAVFHCCDTTGQQIALRCLLHAPPPDLPERYLELERHRQAYPLPFFVAARCIPDTI